MHKLAARLAIRGRRWGRRCPHRLWRGGAGFDAAVFVANSSPGSLGRNTRTRVNNFHFTVAAPAAGRHYCRRALERHSGFANHHQRARAGRQQLLGRGRHERSASGVLTGRGNLSGSTYSIGELRQVALNGGSSTGDLTAVVSTRSSLAGGLTLGGTTATLSTSYSSAYATTPSVATAVGVFAGAGTEAGRGGLASLVVEPSGSVRGLTQQGCAFSGTLAARRSGNVFDLTLTSTVEPDGSCTSLAPRSGVLQIASNGQALLATATADRNDALGVIANRTTTATGRLGDFPFGLSNSACDNGSAEKAWVKDYINQAYYWRRHVQTRLATTSASAYSVPDYFEQLLWRTGSGALDGEYSYLLDAGEFDNAQQGVAVGHGIEWGIDNLGQIRVLYVEAGSPGAAAGVQRGDRLVSANGVTVTTVPVTSAVIAAIFPNQANQISALGFTSVGNVTRVVNLTAQAVQTSPVFLARTVTSAAGKRVGYLVFNTFIVQSSIQPLLAAMRAFKAAGVSDLVLDLRYNGGGLIDLANVLSVAVAGTARTGDKTFVSYRFNELLPNYRFDEPFVGESDVPADAQLNLPRLIVLSSGATASASELVINSLRPYIPVAVIGDTTFGKPVGQFPMPSCGNYYVAVNFETVNANGQGGFFSGLSPTCTVGDDLNRALGDPAEAQLAAALHYADRGTCPATASAGTRLLRQGQYGALLPARLTTLRTLNIKSPKPAIRR
ncbi:MAG: S41 family peptidase [Betaproteobacteria bacterium]